MIGALVVAAALVRGTRSEHALAGRWLVRAAYPSPFRGSQLRPLFILLPSFLRLLLPCFYWLVFRCTAWHLLGAAV